MKTVLISGVFLRSIHPTAFTDINSTLMTLNLNHNALDRVPEEALKVLTELRALFLGNNQIAGLTKGCFDKLEKVTTLSVGNNMISLIDSEVFREIILLKTVNLDGNLLTEQSDFSALAKAKSLYLRHCSIGSISGPLFQRESGVEVIYLSSNGLSQLHPLAFDQMIQTTIVRLDNNLLATEHICISSLWQPLISLKYLHLYSNAIQSILPYCFQGLVSLYQLMLYNNNITSLEENAFNGLADLRYLRLDSNRIGAITEGTFNGLHNLSILVLNNNNIRTLQSGSFLGLGKLLHLGLSGNLLQTCCVCFSVWDSLSSLERLYLTNNEINSIPSGCFNQLGSLNNLYLDHNNVSVLENDAFGKLGSLTNLYLNHNYIRIIGYGSFSGLFNLTALDLQNNKITTIVAGSFWPMSKLVRLNLRGNNLMAVSSEVFPLELAKVLNVDVRQNQLLCSCDLSWVKSSTYSIYSIGRYNCKHSNGSGTSNLMHYLTVVCQMVESPKKSSENNLVISPMLISLAVCGAFIIVAIPIIVWQILKCRNTGRGQRPLPPRQRENSQKIGTVC